MADKKTEEELVAEKAALEKAAERAAAKKNVEPIKKPDWHGKYNVKFTEGITFTHAGDYIKTKTGDILAVNETLFRTLLTRGCVELIP